VLNMRTDTADAIVTAVLGDGAREEKA